MNIEDFKIKLFKKAAEAGFDDCEMFYSKGNSFKVNIFKGDIEKYQNNVTNGVSFRGVFNGVMGYAYSEKIDEESIDIIIKGAVENSKIINTAEREVIYEGDKSYAKLDIYNEDLNRLSVSEKIDLAKKMEKAALQYDERIKSVNTCVVSNGEGEIYIANTKGLNLFQKDSFAMAYVSAIAEENGQTKTNGEFWIGDSWKKFNPVQLGENAAKKVLSYLGSQSLKSGKYNVIFKNEAFADLIGAFISNFYAERVQKGFSLLEDKVGKKIAADILTLADEPLLKGGLASTAFDSEGVATYNKNIIENGVLKTYFYNLKSAKKDNVKSTGNGFRGSFKGSVSTAPTNLYVKPAELSYDELIQKLENGIIITELAGLHSGTNSISGDFSLAADGFLVENGKIVRPVEQITIASNFYEVIKNIKYIADDLFFNLPSQASIGSPSVIVEAVNIAGM